MLHKSIALAGTRCMSRIAFISNSASLVNSGRYLIMRSALLRPSIYSRSTYSTSTRSSDQFATSIDIMTSGGTTEQLKVTPSYPTKPKAVENLLNGLRELVSFGPSSDSAVSYETNFWLLDREGNAIHRHFELYDQRAVQEFLVSVKTISDGVNHHPHYNVQGHLLTITCATHVPPGLSMKDVKLARLINQSYEDFKASQPRVISAGIEQREIDMLRTFAETQNNLEIQRAKDSCNCAS